MRTIALDQLNRLALFAEVVEAGSLSEASRRLGIVKSSLSHRIAELERELGARLLERSVSGVRLTDMGATLHTHARAILREAKAAQAALRAAEAPTGRLRISTPTGIADPLILPVLARFMEAYPGIGLDIVATDSILDLEKERIDVAIRLGWIETGDFIARPLVQPDRLIVASPTFLEKAGPIERPADLERLTWVGFVRFGPKPVLQLTGADGAVAEVSLTCRVTTTNAASLKQWVLMGVGAAHLPAPAVAEELAEGRLVPVLPGWRLATPTLYAVYRPEARRPANVRRLIDFVIRDFEAREGRPARP